MIKVSFPRIFLEIYFSRDSFVLNSSSFSYNNSVQIPKYEAQYRSLIEQFDDNMYFNNQQMVFASNENQSTDGYALPTF